MYQEMRTKDDAWMQSIHESIDQLSEILDSMSKTEQPYRTMMSTYATRRWHICSRLAEGHWANTEAMAHCLTMFSVEKFCTSEVRLSRHWNGSTTASTYLIAADKPLYILEGVKFTACPYIHLMQNNSAPMDRNKNSIQKGYQCKNPFVCCLFIFIYIFVSRSFPLPSAFWVQTLKGERFSGWILSVGGRFSPKRLAAPTFQLSRADVLPSQTSKGKGRMTESGNS